MAAPSVLRVTSVQQSNFFPSRSPGTMADSLQYGGSSSGAGGQLPQGGGVSVGAAPAVGGARYIQGWRNTEQDRRPPPRVARVVSQDYEVIKKTCLEQNALWEDPSFPTVDASIYPSSRQPLPFKWKRPGELCSDPRMFVDGFARFDVVQGKLGNCWFLAATASLCATRSTTLFYRVVPLDNLFVKDYAGVFHFQLWQYGRWIDVVIDDRLPTINGRLEFVHSPTHNEFWPALLEKAYAKLNGSYEALQGGSTAEAMEDFTGGVTETFILPADAQKLDLFTIMRKAFERSSLLGCGIESEAGQAPEEVLPNGLILGHAYSITAVKQTKIGQRSVNLVRIRNPWGNEFEWKGAWCDGSPEWKLLTEEQKETLGLAFKDDGEFWMSYEDFIKNFTKVEVCMLEPRCDLMTTADSEGDIKAKRTWKMSLHDGSWKRQVNAGGCRNFLETFWTNPQYAVEVIDPDEDDDDNTGTLIIALMQKERRKKRQEGLELLTIGYLIYKISSGTTGPLDVNFFRYNQSVARSTFTNMREIVGRHKLAPGRYVVVPCTFKPNEEADFLLRIFSEQKAPAAEMDEETGLVTGTNEKVKDDVPIFSRKQDTPGTVSVTGRVKADAELKRLKAQAVTANDIDEEREMRDLFKNTAGIDLEIDPYELRSILDAKFKSEFHFEGVSLETARSMVAMMDLRVMYECDATNPKVKLPELEGIPRTVDHSGKLGYEEFKKLWMDIRQWKAHFQVFTFNLESKVFHEYDRFKTSTLDSFELRAALNSAVGTHGRMQRGMVIWDDHAREGNSYALDGLYCKGKWCVRLNFAGFRVSNSTFSCLAIRYSDQQGQVYFDDFILCAVRLKSMFETFNMAAAKNGTSANFSLDAFIQTTMYS